mmetsp:Transcript_5438/g.4608  ORF Transcript_5438/g.4608 Transcript_5438/m.4608 type:complete len:132 (+) Transcript_5438:524-919(+)
MNTDNLHISVYKKRKDRSITNETSEENRKKFSARHHKNTKSSERIDDKYQRDSRGNSRKRKIRTKKHHTGSEILLKDQHSKVAKERNISVEISKNKSIVELYKAPKTNSINIKKKSIQYAMKRSRINDLLK